MTNDDFNLEVLRVCKIVGERNGKVEFNNFVAVLERNYDKIDKKDLAIQIEIVIGYLAKICTEKIQEVGVSGKLNKENKKFIEFLNSY